MSLSKRASDRVTLASLFRIELIPCSADILFIDRSTARQLFSLSAFEELADGPVDLQSNQAAAYEAFNAIQRSLNG